MNPNGGENNGQNIDTKWFTEGEFLWRTGASVTWLILCLPCSLLVFTSIVSFDVFHPLSWISDIFNTLFAIHFWLVFIFYGMITVFLVVATNKFNSVQDVTHKNRISSILFLLHPSHLLHMFLCCVFGGLSSWFMLGVLSKPFDSLTILSEESEDECFLNEYGVFVVVFGSWLGFYTSLQYFLNKEFHFTFPVIQQRKFFRVKAVAWQCIYKAVVMTLKAIRWFYPLYYIFGYLPRKMIATFLAASTDRDSVPLDTLSGLLDINMFWVVMCTGTLMSFIWVFNNVLFVIYNTQAFQFCIESSLGQDKDKCLPAVIKSKNVPLLRYLAFLDLYQLSQFSSHRRKQIFSLSQPGGRPANWTSICNECLSMLDDFVVQLDSYIEYQIYQRQQNASVWPNPSLSKNIDSLMSPPYSPAGSPLHSPLHRPRLWSSHTGKSNTERQSFLSPHQKVTPSCNYYTPTTSPKAAEVNSLQWRIKQVPHNFAMFMKGRPVIAYLFNEIPSHHVETLFVDCQLYIWAVQGLSRLVVASFSEDTYGVVQMTLPKILSTLLTLLQTLDRFAKLPTSGRSAIQPRPPRPQGKEGMRYSLRAALVSSIYHITKTFGHHLHGISLTPEHLARLKGFLENREP